MIADRGFLEEADAAGIIFQVLHGIKYMHSHGIVHRDLKPENLMVTKDAIPTVKITGTSYTDRKLVIQNPMKFIDVHVNTDFGSSKNFESNKLSTFVGTPDYLAPEVIMGKVRNCICCILGRTNRAE